MAPEQARGDNAAVGRSADVYALGAILYECLTGRPPFRAANPLDTLLQVVSDLPILPRRLTPGVPGDLEAVCLKCLEKRPEHRYGSAAEFADELGRFLNHQPTRIRQAGWTRQLWLWCKRDPITAGLSAYCALLLMLVTGWALLRVRTQGQRLEEEV